MASDTDTVLLVDDDTFLVDMYTTKFESAGYTVESALGGVEGLKKLENGLTPDIILVDIVMPDVDGIEFLKRAQTYRTDGKPKIVVLSNQGEQADIDAAKEQGADDYIVKANTVPSDVIARIETLLAND